LNPFDVNNLTKFNLNYQNFSFVCPEKDCYLNPLYIIAYGVKNFWKRFNSIVISLFLIQSSIAQGVMDAGIELSLYVILGIGGKGGRQF